ncbi:SH2 domain-containing protein A-like [Cornus florida]|uniref:SH2 domain-containing protein A-like n=1 Tax=Cornus florida TaxID=4283 RepID=UPI00289AE45E|nr:SH2 domain-containing protein A-like [Cornus florida]
MGTNVAEADDYSSLKDLRIEIDGENGTFSLCFWLYLTNFSPLPSIILRQVNSDTAYSIPFIVLNEKKRLMILPLLFLHEEAPTPGNFIPWTEAPHATANIEFPMKKWVHVGCEVSIDFVRLHIDGEIVGEKPLTSSLDDNSNILRRLHLASIDEDEGCLQGYVRGVEVLPLTSSIKDHYAKDPPVNLSIDRSSASEIEEESEGVWSIVGGKASCRRNFSLDVVLFDAFGQPVNKEMEVGASLLYDDNGAPVEKPCDAEAPLLTSYDGIEFACFDRPSKLINGRASFKLKISQLSSKCDNRLFQIRFDIPKMERYPFLEAFSPPIRCISRNRNTRISTVMCNKSISMSHLVNGSQSSGLDDGSTELLQNIIHEAKPSLSSKRVKLSQENLFASIKPDITLERADEECNSRVWTTNEDDNAYGTSLEVRLENDEETDNSPSDSESIEARNSVFKCMSANGNPVSDLTVFKYCLGGLTERSFLLKEFATSASEQELADFAQQVSLFSGCSHHRHQITMAKRLIEEGTKVWNLISPNNHHVLWDNVASEIMDSFMKIACCSTRFLTQQDFKLLRRIAGCKGLLARENFEKMWCWLYPVAFTLSRDWINAMWDSESPKWIEGFITKEEAESSLQGPGVLQDPGTFVLRFPTSRSWPHPDAGNLIVTYIGSDYIIHNRLLSLDFIYSSGEKEMTMGRLQDMLLAEPELSRLGRIIRSHQLG